MFLTIGGQQLSLEEASNLGIAGPWSITDRKTQGWPDLEAVLTLDFCHREKVANNFGLLIAIDLYELNANAEDMLFVNKFMNDMPAAVGMTLLREAITLYYDGGDVPSDRGITSTSILCESHVACHFFPEQDFGTFCLYSCKAFDPASVTALLTEAFGCKDFDVQVLHRGRRYDRRKRYPVKGVH